MLLYQVNDTKTDLESCLQQWSEYSTSNEQVLRWFKDIEKRLQDIQPKVDLGEKKAELQQIKVRSINITFSNVV